MIDYRKCGSPSKTSLLLTPPLMTSTFGFFWPRRGGGAHSFSTSIISCIYDFDFDSGSILHIQTPRKDKRLLQEERKKQSFERHVPL
ncbi:unnamed protein product [Citrullus colocynthis]|uniref:Uncharacterized protein n=1 Tax=Citrullus colocynthis TaxID=252529 RepID=A0ABP0YAM7_9ROSI